MKRTITVSASFGGKISTGQYENSSPFFSASEVFEIEDTLVPASQDEKTGEITESIHIDVLDLIAKRQQALQAICTGNFEAEVIKARIAKIQADRKDFRIIDGRPSVTTVLNYDSDFRVSEEDLKQYAAQGTIIHAQVAEFIKSGEWKPPEKVEGIGAELFIIKKGNLNLPLEGWDFPSFVKKYKLENMVNGQRLINQAHSYCGEFDFICTVDGKRTLCDVKRTVDKDKNFRQIAAYANMDGMEKVEQMMIVPLNDKTDQGFSKPVVNENIERYFDLFLFKRTEFRKVYGI